MQGAKLEILLIADNFSEAERIKEMLSNARRPEFSLQHVQRLTQGLDLLARQRFDLVLLDLGLPESQGLETALALRNQSKATPIVVLTPLDDQDAALKLLQADIQDCLVRNELNGRVLMRSIHYSIQRKRQLESLRDSEAKFSQAFRVAPVLLSISTTSEGRYLDVNEEFVQTLGFPREEVIGHSSVELGIWQTPGDRELMIRMLRENKKVRNFETRLRKKDGSPVIGLISCELIAVEGAEQLLTITRDISELRRAEEERTRLAFLVESSQDAIIGKTLEGIIISWNKGAEMIYGYPAPEVLGRHISLLTPPEQPDEIPQILEKVKSGEYQERLETTRVRKDGRRISVALTISPIRDENDRIVGASTIARDISERKRAEQEIVRLNASLVARAGELEAANRDLEAFNYTVAHDLRRPLNVVTSYCQVISMQYGEQLPQECRDYVQGVYDGALRMNELIEALLEFSSLARVEPRWETVDLSVLAREVAAELQSAEPGRQVHFRIADGVTACGDGNLLRIVLNNLLGNAWKYTGVRETAEIELFMTGSDGQKLYCIRDNGPGFSKADAELIFAPFQRLPSAGDYHGFGIGLATVERIIQRHGGRVWAEGEPGRGATFYFTLPANCAEGG